jgi:hypothetical protein
MVKHNLMQWFWFLIQWFAVGTAAYIQSTRDGLIFTICLIKRILVKKYAPLGKIKIPLDLSLNFATLKPGIWNTGLKRIRWGK